MIKITFNDETNPCYAGCSINMDVKIDDEATLVEALQAYIDVLETATYSVSRGSLERAFDEILDNCDGDDY